MKIKMTAVEELKKYGKNPRILNSDAIDSLAESIEQFGFQQPIVVDKNLVIIAGHTRLEAALKLGLSKVPVLVADGLSEHDANRYRISDNKTGEMTTWDIDILSEELSRIDSSIPGFDDEEIEMLKFIDIGNKNPELDDNVDHEGSADKKPEQTRGFVSLTVIVPKGKVIEIREKIDKILEEYI